VAQGYFPTQQRIVAAIARLIVPPSHSPSTVLDAGCGCGEAIAALCESWRTCAPQSLIKLYGIESDRERHRQALSQLVFLPPSAEVGVAVPGCHTLIAPVLLA
jgi:hypothetical protein